MKVLVIAPHADDEVIGVGGTFSRFTDGKSKKKVFFTPKSLSACNASCLHCSTYLSEYSGS